MLPLVRGFIRHQHIIEVDDGCIRIQGDDNPHRVYHNNLINASQEQSSVQNGGQWGRLKALSHPTHGASIIHMVFEGFSNQLEDGEWFLSVARSSCEAEFLMRVPASILEGAPRCPLFSCVDHEIGACADCAEGSLGPFAISFGKST